jgi:hypothetical protein
VCEFPNLIQVHIAYNECFKTQNLGYIVYCCKAPTRRTKKKIITKNIRGERKI